MGGSRLLVADGVRLGCVAADRFEAVAQAGEVLVGLGVVEPGYVDAMAERERQLSSYVGEGFALPHGTDASRALVRHAALAFLQFPDGVDWDGQDVRACVAVAARADEHVAVLAQLATVLLDPAQAEELRTARDPVRVLEILTPAESTDHEEIT